MIATTTIQKRDRTFSLIESLAIVALAAVPLFLTFPYRVNIFLSWEGAYRMSLGQVPYRDFGMPLGYMYWVIPSLFFKIFGPQLISLVKAQVLINIISGFAFRSILKSLDVQPGIRLLSVLLYCISFSFFNFWPWYNHTVIVYQMVGLAYLVRYCSRENPRWWLLCLSALFTFFSFFTKQDGGGLALILCLALLTYYSWSSKKWKALGIFAASFFVIALLFILPLTRFGFGYWFNHGQPPHTSRVSLYEILDEFLISSQWIKFYLFLVALTAIAYYSSLRSLLTERRTTLFLLLTLGILAEAAILQVTSYTPPDNNIFFHSFAFAWLLSMLAYFLKLHFSSYRTLLVGILGLGLWWSGVFWKYIQRLAYRVLPDTSTASTTGENMVNRKTYMIRPPSTEVPMHQWTFAPLKNFEKIYMPGPTVEGIQRLMADSSIRNKKGIRVLNMSELTPLAAELPYELERGAHVPLWYHLGVGMFNKEAQMYEKRIAARYYDLVLFEHIPTLNNFYPFRVREQLKVHYQLTDSFPAPRRGEETQGLIEIYRRR